MQHCRSRSLENYSRCIRPKILIAAVGHAVRSHFTDDLKPSTLNEILQLVGISDVLSVK